MAEEARRMHFGPTGDFPMGKLNDTDEGEITLGIAADTKNQRVILNFGKPVAWIGFTYESAMAMSESFRNKAFALRGIRS
jgi:hypothetical protein